MSDLVHRLRDGEGDGLVGGCQGCYHAVMDEAADEIIMLTERVRARDATIEHLNQIIREYGDDLAALSQ